MKKLLILLTLLALVFSMLACGKDETDYVFDAFENVAAKAKDNSLGTFFDEKLDTMHVSVSLDTLDGAKKYESLISSFIGDFTVPDVQDGKADIYFDFKNLRAAQLVKAEIDGNSENLSVYEGLDNVYVESSLLEEKYTAKTKDLANWYTGSDDAYNELSTTLPKFMSVAGMFNLAAGVYGDAARDAFRNNVDIDKEKDGKNLILSFTLTEEELDAICEEFADAAEKDKNLAAAMGISVSEILDGMRKCFDDVEITLDIEMTVVKKDATLLNMNVAVSDDDEERLEIAYEYDADSDGFEFNVAVLHPEDMSETIALVGTFGKEYEFSWAYANDTEEYSIETEQGISVVITDEDFALEAFDLYEYIPSEGKPSKSEKSFSAVFDHEITEDKITLELVKAGINGINITNIESLFGVTVEIEKNVAVPSTSGGKDIGSLDNVYNNVVYEIGNKLLELMDM